MPGLKGRDLGAGPWVRQGPREPVRAPRHSSVVCPRCGYPLHVLLVEAGLRIHFLCSPTPIMEMPCATPTRPA